VKRLTFKDLIATVIVIAVAIPYVGYLIRGEMPFVQDPRGMAAVGVIGLIACFGAWGVGIHTTFGKVMLLAGVAVLGLGISAALIGAEGSELLLAIFMAAIALVYLAETAYHAMSRRDSQLHSTQQFPFGGVAPSAPPNGVAKATGRLRRAPAGVGTRGQSRRCAT
jgi:hypothetical protein